MFERTVKHEDQVRPSFPRHRILRGAHSIAPPSRSLPVGSGRPCLQEYDLFIHDTAGQDEFSILNRFVIFRLGAGGMCA